VGSEILPNIPCHSTTMQADWDTRLAMGVEYDGSDFRGWQVQGEVRTVQACLEEAIARVADHPVTVHCAGRTDAGVHALEQVIHFDTRARRRERSWVLGTNVNLSSDVRVRWAQPVDRGFHARFSATARHYRYLILTRDTGSALLRDRVAWFHHALDRDRMREAARALVGEHDFTSFRAIACQARHAVRCIHYLEVYGEGSLCEIRVGANGFLHHMVRNIAGVLMAIGRGDRPVSWAADVLAARDRTSGGVTAPPEGLYFVRVDYPPHFDLPQAAPMSPTLGYLGAVTL
jgi:tRNA pseudouridine38-40 synthase